MQLISTFSFVEISTFFSVINMYIKISLISQVAPYLMIMIMNGLFTYLGINTMNHDMFTQIQ